MAESGTALAGINPISVGLVEAQKLKLNHIRGASEAG